MLQRDTSSIILFGGNNSSTAVKTTTAAIATTTAKETGLQPFVKQKFRETRFSKLTRGLRKSAGYVIEIAR